MRGLVVLAAAAAAAAAGGGSRHDASWGTVAQRLALTGQLLAARAQAWLAADAAAAVEPPAYPPVCNMTYNSQSGLSAEQRYLAANLACFGDFQACFMAGNKNNNTCTYMCTAELEQLQRGCDTTYCLVEGVNLAPANQNLPKIRVKAASCYPLACDEAQNAVLTALWRYTLCGDPLWSSPDCAIQMTCAYQLPTNTVWIIVGAVVGTFVLCAGGLAGCWYYQRAKNGGNGGDGGYEAAPGGDDDGAALGRGAADSVLLLHSATDEAPLVDDFDALAPLPPRSATSAGHTATAAGSTYTMVDMRRPGGTQATMLDADSDRL